MKLVFLVSMALICRAYRTADCVDAGECVPCSASEKVELDHCSVSGKHMQQRCKNSQTGIDYRPCWMSSGEEEIRVLIFQVLMAICGGLAYWGVLARKQRNMTAFDHRREAHNGTASLIIKS